MDERRTGEDRRSRWQDERIDDLARIVDSNERKLDATANVTAANSLQLEELIRRENARSEHHWVMGIAVLTVVLGQIGTIVAIVTSLPH